MQWVGLTFGRPAICRALVNLMEDISRLLRYLRQSSLRAAMIFKLQCTQEYGLKSV